MLGAMDKFAQSLFFAPVNDALGIVRRFEEGRGLKTYVMERMTLVAPIGALIVVTSFACAAATVLYLGGTRSLFVLLAFLLVPFVLAGSLFVQAYVFASWLEGRALAKALHRKPAPPRGPISIRLRKAGIDMGEMPPVPWLMVTLFLALPLAMLLAVVPDFAAVLILLHLAAPVVFARLDQ
jgi:hypothetical protein